MTKIVKNILVTGSDGFIGKKLVPSLRERGHNVAGLTIDDFDICSQDIKNTGPMDHVFHLAGLTFVPQSWDTPGEYYRVNTLGTENILELCKEQECSLTFISTYVYGQPQYIPVDEKHPVAPNSPYNHSKYLAEQICEFYHKHFDINTTVFRPFNIYGEGQAEYFLIPKIIKQLYDRSKEEIVLKSLSPKRDYVFIDDVIDALIISLDNTNGYEIFNLASGVSKSVQEIVDILLNISNIKKGVISEEIERVNEITDICGSAEKAKSLLKWVPKTELEEGLRKTIGLV